MSTKFDLWLVGVHLSGDKFPQLHFRAVGQRIGPAQPSTLFLQLLFHQEMDKAIVTKTNSSICPSSKSEIRANVHHDRATA